MGTVRVVTEGHNDNVADVLACLSADPPNEQSEGDISQFHGQVLLGDAFDLFDRIPEQSVDLIITSPPYWGHREYGLEHNWETFNDIKAVKRDFRIQSDGTYPVDVARPKM